MNRREFVLLSAAATLAPAFPALAAVSGSVKYKPGLVDKRLAKGETLFLDFSATWCSTCKAQERVINALNAANPAYQKSITFVNVDWDDYGNGELATWLNIPRRSTLVVLQGSRDNELGRVVAGTSKKTIQELMDVALGAANA